MGMSNAGFTAVTEAFAHKAYDVTNYWVKFMPPLCICTLCTITTKLELEPEEAVLSNKNCLCTSIERRPYGELGSVEKNTAFGCCASFQFGKVVVMPGCGCSGRLVEEIVRELKARMKARGDTGQIRRAEQHLAEIQVVKADVANLNAKVDAILEHLKIAPPQPVAAASMVERL
ncbi:hypothetical protein CTAYLR_010394 [Chrysophaeum taylorii]|uniref:Uncharacterized protein n=1 Tax=Chrysophaeum taylorii TaxID=2483200 RepID=A0AAD7UN85_9STRA|nr:hypothetical protein CTAYLR_010394 [Chrysophaeum taylorii]